jgi:hypothetical protein
MVLPMEKPKIQYEHSQDEDIEKHPWEDRILRQHYKYPESWADSTLETTSLGPTSDGCIRQSLTNA